MTACKNQATKNLFHVLNSLALKKREEKKRVFSQR